MRVALIQYKISGKIEENVRKTLGSIRNAAGQGAQVVCLQELFATPYFCQTENEDNFGYAHPLGAEWAKPFFEIAAELELVVIVPFFEKRAPGLFHNSAMIIDADGSLVGVYRKMHIPDDPQFYEKYYFTPGSDSEDGFRAWDTRYGRIGVCICWDQWFPEAARLTALDGAEIIFYPTAIGWLPEDKAAGLGKAQQDSWHTIQRSHAIANGVFIAAVNRVGFEENPAPGGDTGIEFWGSSFIADPTGTIIAEAGLDEQILVADCDPAKIEEQRIAWPFFRDRRIDAYGKITERYLHTK